MPGPSDLIVNQALHGYQRGHRLIASSGRLDDEDRMLLARNSDAASRYRPSTGAYLTGYGLPSGAYVLARTWPERDADRPNTVWTHSLLIERSDLRHASLERLARQLRTPAEHVGGFGAYEEPLRVAASRPGLSGLTPDAAYQALSVYTQGSARVAVHDAAAAEGIAFAVWDQLWTPLRHSLAFCTALESDRFAASPFAVRFRSLDDFVSDSHRPGSLAEEVVAHDLAQPGGFREFLHFVGAGQVDPELIWAFAECYGMIDRGSVGDVTAALARVAPSPRTLRRLKRRMLARGHGGHAEWRVEAIELLDELANGRLGEIVAAEDAHLGSLIGEAWNTDAGRTVELLANASVGLLAADTAEPQSARDSLAAGFSGTISGLLSTQSLPLVAQTVPDLLLRALMTRGDEDLWRAWAELPTQVRERTVAVDPEEPDVDWGVALSGARSHDAAIEALLSLSGSVLPELLRALAADAEWLGDSSLSLDRAVATEVRRRMSDETDPRMIVALCRLADPDLLPKEVAYSAWRAAIADRQDSRVAAFAYLVGRKRAAGHTMAAHALELLTRTLAQAGSGPAWKILRGKIRSARGESGRSARLVHDFSAELAKVSASESLSAIAEVSALDEALGRSLLELTAEKREKRSGGPLRGWLGR